MPYRPVGRPQKYKSIIDELKDDALYTPASIVHFAEKHDLLPDIDGDPQKRLIKQRIRIAMIRFSNIHAFPDKGDGIVTLWRQAPTPGWFGWRWKTGAGGGDAITITLTLPVHWQSFFDTLTQEGYDHSELFLQMIRILKTLYDKQVQHIPDGLMRMVVRLMGLVEGK